VSATASGAAGAGRTGPPSKYPATAHNSLSGLAWPGLPTQHGTRLIALLYQLELSQWWTPQQLRRQQFRQLAALLQHTFKHVPHYRAHREA